MQNPIRRLFESSSTTRIIDLSVSGEADTKPGAACEVTEFDGLLGWARWNDSVFVRDFEDSVLTEPAPLLVESQFSDSQAEDLLAPFSGFGTLS